MEFYIHTWHVYGVEMYNFVNSELDKINEKKSWTQWIYDSFWQNSPLILISATAVKVTFVKKHPDAPVPSILKLAPPLRMNNAASVKHFI